MYPKISTSTKWKMMVSQLHRLKDQQAVYRKKLMTKNVGLWGEGNTPTGNKRRDLGNQFQGMVVHIAIPTLRRHRQKDHKFGQAGLHGETLSQKKKISCF
jgi:hypothetical protein